MISVIIPFHNEEESLSALYDKLKSSLSSVKQDHEIIFVNDGSTDHGRHFIDKLSAKDKRVILINLRKRSGKGRALEAGFSTSQGSAIIFMDADLQNDPSDIPQLLDKLDEGYELINGYRKLRLDNKDKTLPSKIYNKLIGLLFKIDLHDINCGFKVMKRIVLETIPIYGDNYRILPILAKNEGFKIVEMEVSHHPRKFGVSKYGPWRMMFGFLDVMSYFFVLKYFEKPLHFFGAIGAFIFFIGSIILIYLGIERLFFNKLLFQRPVLFLGLLLFIVGVQIIATGFIGELIVFLNKRKNKI